MVRAKFKVESIIEEHGNFQVKMSAVIPFGSESSENNQFFAATPSGKLDMAVVRKETAERFEVGKEYYLDFTPA